MGTCCEVTYKNNPFKNWACFKSCLHVNEDVGDKAVHREKKTRKNRHCRSDISLCAERKRKREKMSFAEQLGGLIQTFNINVEKEIHV